MPKSIPGTRTLKRDFRRAIQQTALMAMLPLFLLTLYSTHTAFSFQGRFVSTMLGNLAADRLQNAASGVMFPSASGTALADTVPETVSTLMKSFVATRIAYERIPGLPTKAKWQTVDAAVGDLARFRIVWDNRTLFEDPDWDTSPTNADPPLFHRFESLFRQEMILTFGRASLGQIQIRLQPAFWARQFIVLLVGLLLSTVVALWLLKPFASHFSRTFSQPFASMASLLSRLADGDYGTTIRTQVSSRKPLREIQSIVRDTNTLLEKLRHENDLQLAQQAELTALNGRLSVQHDLLESSQREIQNAQIQLIQSQSLASVGQLTAAISHEITEPLIRITENLALQCQLLDDAAARTDLPEMQRDVLDQLQAASDLNRLALDRVTALMQGLRSFSRPESPDGAPADLAECVRNVVLITANLWKRRIRMIEEYAALPAFPFHPGMLNQVVMNLVVNAVHAIDGEGEIRIRTWREGETAFLSVADTGSGIPDDILPRIFESGFTTKAAGKGSGLGLAICADIVRQHGGKLSVASRPGAGSTFTVSLPMMRTDG